MAEPAREHLPEPEEHGLLLADFSLCDSPLGEREQQMLALERQWWKYAGAKEQAIRELSDLSATHYYQLLNALIDTEDALATIPCSSRDCVDYVRRDSGHVLHAAWVQTRNHARAEPSAAINKDVSPLTRYARDEFDKAPETASRQGVHRAASAPSRPRLWPAARSALWLWPSAWSPS